MNTTPRQARQSTRDDSANIATNEDNNENLTLTLNEAFYTGSPDEYFLQRLFNLMLIVGGDERLDEIVESGITYRSLRLVPPSASNGPEDETSAALERFAAVEAELLFHHVGEVLLRLYFAHVDIPRCPWVALTSMRDFRAFKKRVTKSILKRPVDALADDIVRTFFGAKSPEELGIDTPKASWDEGLESITRIMRIFGQHILKRGNLYNAAKHGFGITAGDAQFSIEGDDETFIALAKGPAIEYLEQHGRDSEGRQRWSRTVSWVSIERAIALTYAACYALQALWSTGRRRYTGSRQIKLFSMPTSILDEISRRHDNVLYDLREHFLVVVEAESPN